MSVKIIREAPGWKPPAWVAIVPAQVFFKATDMTPEACKAWVLDTMRGCMTGEREAGSDADRLLMEAAERMAKRSNAGRTAAEARWRGDANAMRTHSERNAEVCQDKTRHETDRNDRKEITTPTDRQTDRPDIRQTSEESGSEIGDEEIGVGIVPDISLARGDAYAELGATYDEDLPTFAVRLCEEPGNQKAVRRYQAAIGKMGPARFRQLLEMAIGSWKVDGEPRNKGAAFNAFVGEAIKALEAQEGV